MMLRLINDSLDVARIEAGKLELQCAALDLHAIVHEVALLAEPLAKSKGLDWKATIEGDAPRHVRGDALRVKQVVLNLLNNAIKFTAAGEVTFQLARGTDGAALFTVRDTGPGIAAADQARLFQRFEQIDGPQRRSGSGLGLAICRELVARMGGEIMLESTPGRGSTFCVRVPLAEVAAPVAQPAATALMPATSAGRILLVEDDATVAAVVVGLLVAEGHRVQHVDNALAALAELATSSYDIVFIDLDLPGIDGFTLARMIRTRAAGAACPCLIGISARSGGDEEALCLGAGMQAFVRKPVTAAVLQSLIHQMAPPATPNTALPVCSDP
jgi:CheY-like chemotaxis protein/anti-sigma regulatory factor (Ser/Thr protein kinase)